MRCTYVHETDSAESQFAAPSESYWWIQKLNVVSSKLKRYSLSLTFCFHLKWHAAYVFSWKLVVFSFDRRSNVARGDVFKEHFWDFSSKYLGHFCGYHCTFRAEKLLKMDSEEWPYIERTECQAWKTRDVNLWKQEKSIFRRKTISNRETISKNGNADFS